MYYSQVVQIPGAEEDSALAAPVRVYWVKKCAVVLIKGTLLAQKSFRILHKQELLTKQWLKDVSLFSFKDKWR